MSDTATLDPGVNAANVGHQHIDPATGRAVENKPEPAEVPKGPRARSSYEGENVVITWGDGTVSRYDSAALNETARQYLVLRGLAYHIRSHAADPEQAWTDLMSGKLTTPRETKPRETSHWKPAIAAALVEITKKNPVPLTLDAATARVATLDRSQLAAFKTDPIVVKHHARITGKKPEQSNLLSLID